MNSTPSPSAFCREMLARTSRTFALNVPMLPRPLDEIVTTAYLLCRVADTVEDESELEADVRAGLLEELGALVAFPENWRERSEDLADRARLVLGDGTPADEVRLVAGLPLLLDDLAGRPRPVREIVLKCLRDMTSGMARTVLRGDGPADVDEVLDYCDIVAGTVGTMLTELFAWHSGKVAAALSELEPRAEAFGRLLQLTNIVKDVRADLNAGRCWLPRSVLADCGIDRPEQLRDPAFRTRARGVLHRMVAAAHRELVDTIAYLDALPASEKGIRQFCVAPLLMAVLTLRKLMSAEEVFGARPVKITRKAVAAALLTTRTIAARPAALGPLLTALRRSLPRALPPRAIAPEPVDTPAIDDAIKAATALVAKTQSPSGSWHADYGSMPIFLSFHVITCYVVGAMPDAPTCARMEHHYRVRQNPDGGWGIDVESDSMVMATVLGYTAMRLLGVSADDACLRRARSWFLRHGGALAMPHWGKVFLAVLGVFDWRGLYPFLPEAWLLPRRLSVHPGRLWSFARQVYASMSWLYAHRYAIEDDLTRELRTELYPTRYEDVDWRRSRALVASTDSFVPRSWLLRAAFAVFSVYERRPSKALRERAITIALDLIEHENRSSNFIGHGPVPNVLDTLVWHFARPGGEEVAAHVKRLPDYLWDDADDGTRVQSYNSTESWDTALAVQALAESSQARETLRAAAGFLARNQLLTEIPGAQHHFRHPSSGGWSLSTAEQGWAITDGTAEALKAVIALNDHGLADEFTPERRLAAVELVLSTQNADGGWPVYERVTAPKWLEKLNFSDVLENVMLDHSTVETSSSCVVALRRYRDRGGPHPRIDAAIARGEDFLLRRQRADGSWEGFWGVCFTYGTWFGIRGLVGSGDPRAAAAIDRACEFLLAHQRADGGWGETIHGYRHRRYIHAATSQSVMTSWAVLALVDAGRADSPAVRAATAFLLRAQQPGGGWQDQHLPGAMMRCAALNYSTYSHIFPLWALSAIARRSS